MPQKLRSYKTAQKPVERRTFPENVQKLLSHVLAWAKDDPQMESVILVGSYARGRYTDTSDVDLVLLTPGKAQLLRTQTFVEAFGTVGKKQTEDYGACTSIRVWYQDGPEVEFGLVGPSWIALPLDEGTRQVLLGGYQVLLDKQGYFQNLPE